MARSVDLNSDMGEGFGRWPLGEDAALLDIVTSANIACGFHAGDPDVMDRTMRMAAARGVGIGAHPGFPDLQGFGRRRMHMPDGSLASMIRYQVGAAAAMARAAGAELAHVKLHGALSNMASEDAAMAGVCYRAALEAAPGATMVVLAATAQEAAVRQIGCPHAAEIFADRAYNDDATLVDRALPGSVIGNPAEAAARMVAMVGEGAIIAASGRRIATRIDTICLHGDTPGAVAMATAVRAALTEAGIRVARF
ncbi:MAG: 5-oxoprolinase subunit PxpA [Rhodobacteraceae bacterium]|nr:5-oxoprolinase subunit PxpA [Paracoccaceae bacterium]